MSKVIVIGGGAAGLMAASVAAKNNDVLLIEKNKKTGRKILITGKGRCNVTNNCDNETFIRNITKNAKFLYSAINNFSTADTMDFFENLNVPLKTERGNRVFPVSDKAMDIADALYKNAVNNNVEIVSDTVTSFAFTDGKISKVNCVNNIYSCDKVILATGGVSFPLTGSTGDGYKLAKSCGHRITELMPSLIGLLSDDSSVKELQGLSLKNVKIKVIDKSKDKVVYKDFGEMIFTHFGLSGPIILSASAHMRDMGTDRYKVLIDLKPALDENTLDKRIVKDLNKNLNKDISNSLFELLPKSFIPVLLKKAEIDEHTKCNSLKKDERQRLLNNIKNFSVEITGFEDIKNAIITSGGVDVREVDAKTMKSKIIDNLYFAGEILDVDAYTGGFNLQIAFSTAHLAGESV